jgi:hypothetical protein
MKQHPTTLNVGDGWKIDIRFYAPLAPGRLTPALGCSLAADVCSGHIADTRANK